jgi:hypothetical protein
MVCVMPLGFTDVVVRDLERDILDDCSPITTAFRIEIVTCVVG